MMSSKADVGELTRELIRMAREVDEEIKKNDEYAFAFGMPVATGSLIGMMSMMYDRLPDDDFLKEFIPRQLKERIDEIGAEAVMKKLES